MITNISEGKDFHTFDHFSSVSSEKITKLLRRELWKKYFEQAREGTCYVCDGLISEDHFQAGHVIARVRGGSTNIHNLKPVCSDCNLNMKIENMEEYKQRVQRQIQ